MAIVCGGTIYIAKRLIMQMEANAEAERKKQEQEDAEKSDESADEPTIVVEVVKKKEKKSKKVASENHPLFDKAVNGLVSLGMDKKQAKQAVSDAIGGDLEMSIDDIIRNALSSKGACKKTNA